MPRSVELLVCVGSDCSKARGFAEAKRMAEATPGACSVSCQGICSGPVLGLRVHGGRVRWYRRVRGKRLGQAEVVVRTGARRKPLAKLEVRAKRGTLRRPHRVRRLTD